MKASNDAIVGQLQSAFMAHQTNLSDRWSRVCAFFPSNARAELRSEDVLCCCIESAKLSYTLQFFSMQPLESCRGCVCVTGSGGQASEGLRQVGTRAR